MPIRKLQKFAKVFLSIFLAFFTFSCAKNWSYQGKNAAQNWGSLSEEFKFCKIGYNQSPIDVKSGLENAEFARFGGIHRNTFINSPKLLDQFLRFKKSPNISFAGQITGVEGYVESASMGLIAGIFVAAEFANKTINPPNSKTAIGALLNHITLGHEGFDFQPMNVNFGLFENLEEKTKKTDRKNAYSVRALNQLESWRFLLD
jgi:methylenetetrahydrofolate--tRNA-(uracil-5-)-methyltransferase